jgi:hypothetical protein
MRTKVSFLFLLTPNLPEHKKINKCASSLVQWTIKRLIFFFVWSFPCPSPVGTPSTSGCTAPSVRRQSAVRRQSIWFTAHGSAWEATAAGRLREAKAEPAAGCLTIEEPAAGRLRELAYSGYGHLCHLMWHDWSLTCVWCGTLLHLLLFFSSFGLVLVHTLLDKAQPWHRTSG